MPSPEQDTTLGDATARKKQIDALRKKWQEGSTWTLSNMTVKKKQDKFNGCPHGWILNLGAPGLKATLLTGASAEAIPTAVEPPVTVTEASPLHAPKQVAFAIVAEMVGSVGVLIGITETSSI